MECRRDGDGREDNGKRGDARHDAIGAAPHNPSVVTVGVTRRAVKTALCGVPRNKAAFSPSAAI
jgi:hypothetical protein